MSCHTSFSILFFIYDFFRIFSKHPFPTPLKIYFLSVSPCKFTPICVPRTFEENPTEIFGFLSIPILKLASEVGTQSLYRIWWKNLFFMTVLSFIFLMFSFTVFVVGTNSFLALFSRFWSGFSCLFVCGPLKIVFLYFLSRGQHKRAPMMAFFRFMRYINLHFHI